MNSFYELTLLVSRITNANIHLIFWLYEFCFNYLEKTKKIIRRNTCLYKVIIIKICETIEIKLKKYDFKKKSNLIYNFVNILNFISKLNLYKIWNRSKINNNNNDEKIKTIKIILIFYVNQYKTKFLQYYERNYENLHFNTKKNTINKIC